MAMLTFDEIKQKWFASKEGVVDHHRLEFLWADKEYLYYKCLCGSDDHCGMRRMMENNQLSCIVNCYPTRKQWLVRMPDAAEVIRQEENKYLDLLKRAPGIVNKVVKKRGWSEETAAYLYDTHGIDKETAESVL